MSTFFDFLTAEPESLQEQKIPSREGLEKMLLFA